MTIRSGALRHRVTIQSRATTQTASGQPTWNWTTFATVWSSVEPLLGGGEVLAAAQRQARVPTRFRIRYLTGVLPSMRILWDGRLFDIKEVQQPRGIEYEMILITEELVGVQASWG